MLTKSKHPAPSNQFILAQTRTLGSDSCKHCSEKILLLFLSLNFMVVSEYPKGLLYSWIQDIEAYTPGSKVDYPIVADPKREIAVL